MFVEGEGVNAKTYQPEAEFEWNLPEVDEHFRPSGAEVGDLDPGIYLLVFADVPGFVTPESLEVEVFSREFTTIYVQYEKIECPYATYSFRELMLLVRYSDRDLYYAALNARREGVSIYKITEMLRSEFCDATTVMSGSSK